MKTNFMTYGLILFLLILTHELHAADIYVDYRAGYCANCAAGNDNDYDLASRDCGSGSDPTKTVYSTVQAAITAMSPGDHVYMRGGTYQEGSITIPMVSDDGNSGWTEGNYNSLSSYAGEWAILDGQNTTPEGYVLGYPGTSAAELNYWKFERFEIKNARNVAGTYAWGLYVNGGPLWIRYLYVHDNSKSDNGENNPVGIRTHRMRNSIIEYCYFKDNGGTVDSNQSHISVYTDYKWNYSVITGATQANPVVITAVSHGLSNGNVVAIRDVLGMTELNEKSYTVANITTDTFELSGVNGTGYSAYVSGGVADLGLVDINDAVRSNEIRYNLFDGAYIGFKHKGWQSLNDRTGIDMAHQDKGDKIHHNIFLNHTTAIMARQDFCQIYNNIVKGGSVWDQDTCFTCSQMLNTTIYNNTVIEGDIKHPVPYGTGYQVINYHPYFWFVNNIVDSYSNTWSTASITSGYLMVSESGNLNITDQKIDKNFIYNPPSSVNFNGKHILVGRNAGSYSGDFSVSEFNTQYGTTNYLSTSNGLYKGTTGSSQYKTNSNFDLGGFNVGNGGINIAHPYLSVTIPSYVGAVDPNAPDDGVQNWDPAVDVDVNGNPTDSAWVDYVLNVVGNPTNVKNVSLTTN